MGAAQAAARRAAAIRLRAMQRPERAHQAYLPMRRALAVRNRTPCAPVLTVLQAVAARPMVAVRVVVRVALVLEAIQMAIHSVEHAAAQVDSAQQVAQATVLIAGATGLVGKELLALLLASSACGEVHSLVRKPASLQHPKLRQHVVDFAKLGTASSRPVSLPKLDEVYICLGTTIKVAGSQEAFRAVDFDAVLAVARIGIAQGATKLGVISAMGASSSSGVFYSRVKGEMEEAIAKLGYDSVSIARPSLLAGDREALAQNTRPGEKMGLMAMKWLSPLIPKNYQAVQAADVAAALYAQVQRNAAGTHVLLSGQLQPA